MSPALEPLQGKYEIVARMKEGGMGAIYKVRHRLLEEIRVVKVLRQQFEDDAELNKRFIHEARAAIRLRHPNVVQIFDFLVETGVGYLVMEFIDGVDLADLIQRRYRPSLPLFLELACQGLRALGYLHHQGFVHRDISPDNLMLTCDFAGHPLVKMIDLGIAKNLDAKENLTASGMFLGKFRYSSPEHFGSQGSAGIEPRSDLYSYGVVLYELLTGRYPIQGKGNSQLIAGHLFRPPRDFEETDPEKRVPKALREILMRTLDKDPDQRFASATELTAALRELQSQFPVTDATLAEAKEVTVPQQAVKEEKSESGSTQDRLDRGFVHPTPKPLADAPTIATPPPTTTEESVRQQHIDTLLGGAETLSRLKQPEAARNQIETILEIDPENVRARELLATIDGPPLNEDDATLAFAAGGAAPPVSQAPPPPRVSPFDRHLQAGCTLAEEGNAADAVPHFEAALELQPDNEAVRQMLLEARKSLEEERRTALERLVKEVVQLRDLVAEGELGKARERLVSARRAYGDAEALTEVQLEIETEELRLRYKKVEANLMEAMEFREASDFTAAIRTLEGAREALRDSGVGGTEQGLELATRLDEEETVLSEAHREAAELEEAAYEVESLIDRGKLVEADRVIFQAQEAFGSQKRLKELKRRLDERHHQELEKQIRTQIGEAGELTAAGQLDDARKLLEKSRIMVPAGSALIAEIKELESAVTSAVEGEELARHLENRLTRLLDENHEDRDGANLEQARAELAAAEDRLAGQKLFETLRQRVADACQQRLTAIIQEAGTAFESRRYRAAIPSLEQALELAPGDTWIASRLDEARAALAEPDHPEAAVDAIAGLIKDEKVEEAESRLRQAVDRWGTSAELDGLELEIEAFKLTQRNEETRGVIEQARRAFEAGDLLKARLLVARAIELSPVNAAARALGKAIDQAAE